MPQTCPKRAQARLERMPDRFQDSPDPKSGDSCTFSAHEPIPEHGPNESGTSPGQRPVESGTEPGQSLDESEALKV